MTDLETIEADAVLIRQLNDRIASLGRENTRLWLALKRAERHIADLSYKLGASPAEFVEATKYIAEVLSEKPE